MKNMGVSISLYIHMHFFAFLEDLEIIVPQ